MLHRIIRYSLDNKLVIFLMVAGIIGAGVYSLQHISIGAVPDITNNQVQIITTSRSLSTEDVERYLTYPVELEMSNLPGVQEIRSISKFGLSVVTVVFDDDMGTYLPRQLIGERLVSVRESIPEGFGTPTMGPISTGLGEIYQYILDVEDGYESRYSVADLRTIQDWMVKRQLSGIDGVVEINTWGGYLKTYEVGVDPNKLKALDITLAQIYNALRQNNSIAGGGYIEKSHEAYFIRAEGLVNSISDIESIVVEHHGSTPIYIKDIANVSEGSATRFGAITGNGEGEKVLGQVMMLKGASSKEVIDAVKARVAEIQKTLPEGVYINPFLERSELIGRTSFTIAENLILGFLIVLFVVILLLGNIRSGLVVASVIPLTLLFALSMMHLFGVDANLMSLGAIDFGIIIDGAVIIVEFIAYRITQSAGQLRATPSADRQGLLDRIASDGASKMMNSAVFGQLIIIIVFIPIMALTGVEGKMFRPMAMTFCFALIGAMILCFTYVPVMSSLFIRPSRSDRQNVSQRLISWLQSIYEPVLRAALRLRYTVISIAAVLLIAALILFGRIGGEFVPTLDEGDFVIQPVLKTGMSLAETVIMTTRIERIVQRYPEVKQVVTRIGAAEVPTDPMSMEESDIIITLHPQSEWTTATSKDDLAEVLKEALLTEIPGIDIEFTQPIEMRFNELISGARSDLAIQLFGDDLDILYTKAQQIEDLIRDVPGAADISVEKIDGLPQMTVNYDRQNMAKYGVNVSDLNNIISMGFAGKSAGVIFEGESRFDIVVRYEAVHRQDIEHLREALVSVPDGQQLPMREFADISLTSGPAKISRSNTKRNVIVGVNVRGRDLQSVVEDVQQLIDEHIEVPPGYYFHYGGQFENLQQASRRLMIVVPIALGLIFILLYFAFGSIREALLIYSAIPLSAIGGILALYLRGMPFSISAGVGFIALFGIAVLNGIVLIEHFKELKSSDMNDNSYIIAGALDRLRPVLLTALAAALGFLPMAISTSAGAEVQRPLATVVIGGLASATFLTLIVLPVLYSIFGKKGESSRHTAKAALSLLLLMGITWDTPLSAQGLTLDDAMTLALDRNAHTATEGTDLQRADALIDASRRVNPTEFYYGYDHNNTSPQGPALHVLGASHSFLWPGVYHTYRHAAETQMHTLAAEYTVRRHQMRGQVALAYDDVMYWRALTEMYIEIDSLYATYLSTAKRKLEAGETNIIDKITAQQRQLNARMQSQEIARKQEDAQAVLLRLLQQGEIRLAEAPYDIMSESIDDLATHPLLDLADHEIAQLAAESEVAQAEALPEINVSAFNGFGREGNIRLYPGVQLGVSLPLSKKSYKAQKTANALEQQVRMIQKEALAQQLVIRRESLSRQLDHIRQQLKHYDEHLSPTTEDLLTKAGQALNAYQMDYLEYLLILDTTVQSRMQRLALVHQYNQTLIQSIYLIY